MAGDSSTDDRLQPHRCGEERSGTSLVDTIASGAEGHSFRVTGYWARLMYLSSGGGYARLAGLAG